MIAAIAWPLLAALLLGVATRRSDPRVLPLAAFATALPTPMLAARALLSPLHPAAGFWLQDRLALSLQLLLALPLALVTAWRLLADPCATRPPRYWPAGAQLLTGGALVAVRAAWLFPALIGLTIVAGSVLLLQPRHRHLVLPFAALMLTAWLGVACLTAGLGIQAGWAGLQSFFAVIPPALRSCGTMLLMLPMLLLTWTVSAGLAGPASVSPASVSPASVSGDEPSTRVLLPVLVGTPALDIVLRLRALPEADPMLLRLDILLPVGGGLLGMLLACALMPARRRQPDRLMLTAAVQLGAVAVGFGIGGTGGVVAGLMLLAGLVLALPVALLPVPTGLGRWLQRLAVLVLAGLPPFAPFAAGCVLLMRVSGVLALLPLAGFTAGCVLLLAARPVVDTAAARGPAVGAASIPALLALAVLGWLGLAMPPDVSAWLLATSEGMAGAPWPQVPTAPALAPALATATP